MAFSLKTQSKIAMEYKQFIDDYNKYIKDIESIANKPIITTKDKLKVKVMLEILLGEYRTLKPSILLPEKLKKEARIKYEKVRKLYEELFRK